MDITVVCTRNNNAEGGRIRVAKRVIPGTGGLVASRVPSTSCILHNDVRNLCATIPVRSDLQTLAACIRYRYTVRNAIVCTSRLAEPDFLDRTVLYSFVFLNGRVPFTGAGHSPSTKAEVEFALTVTFFCA